MMYNSKMVLKGLFFGDIEEETAFVLCLGVPGDRPLTGRAILERCSSSGRPLGDYIRENLNGYCCGLQRQDSSKFIELYL